jgi:signal transduction histidine kinase
MDSLFPNHRLFNIPLATDVLHTILFGILSWILSLVGVVDDTNLREIPLLICLIHIQKPAFVFVLSLFTLLNPPNEVPLWFVYIVHLVPLVIAWLSFKLVEKIKLSNILFGLSSVGITLGYYLLVLLPLATLAVTTFTPAVERTFTATYLGLLTLSSFEIIPSALVVGFYAVQFEMRKTLEYTNENLSHEVERRTAELTVANNELLSLNEELKSSNENIRQLNENLDRMVRERTDKINDQLKQLSRYAHMNSHEVRAPLARMLGLIQLIRHDNTTEKEKNKLIGFLYDASNELDKVIKEMNRLLEEN